MTLTGRSLRVAIVFLVIILIFFAIVLVFLFVFFLVWLFSKVAIGSDRAIRNFWVEALREYSAHVHMVLCARWLEQRVVVADAAGIN